ncbi:hypothetical protein [Desertibaculum subflavum]|uniref:hypothetical protein n=1 Tax=Desertibaculum subflavum TaxID=2268458 RepID=UPI0013C3FF97
MFERASSCEIIGWIGATLWSGAAFLVMLLALVAIASLVDRMLKMRGPQPPFSS